MGHTQILDYVVGRLGQGKDHVPVWRYTHESNYQNKTPQANVTVNNHQHLPITPVRDKCKKKLIEERPT